MTGNADAAASGGQIPFDFGRPPLAFGDLDVTNANDAAVRALRRWRDWPGPALCLTGPKSCGLTTLARAWSLDADAAFFSAEAWCGELPKDVDFATLDNIAIDCADLVDDDQVLLGAINLAARSGKKLLLTSHTPPAHWPRESADLMSRLRAMPVAEIAPPDEETTRLRLISACRTRYLKLPEEVVDYLCIRLERTYASIDSFAEKLDEVVRRTGRGPSIPTAREALASEPQPDLFDEGAD